MAAPPIPYRLRTERLELRCPELRDTPELHALTLENLPHLAPWMPWTRLEPMSLDEKLEQLRSWRARFDASDDFPFLVALRESGALVGTAGLHTRCGAGGLELGYWIDHRHTGRGLATEAAAALARAGLELHGVRRLELYTAPENEASQAVARRLGFVREGLLRARIPWGVVGGPEGGRGTRSDGVDDDFRDKVAYCMLREEYAGSHAAGVQVHAYDALERELPLTGLAPGSDGDGSPH